MSQTHGPSARDAASGPVGSTTPTVQQYLKTILLVERRSGVSEVGMKVLADAMRVTPGTATSMAKHLGAQGLVEYRPRQGMSLTETGRTLAVSIVRRHRLVETFLERMLEYDWSEVHAEAEELEHVVSDLFIERIDRLLGFPEEDPHGDPIPRPDGAFATRALVPLSEAPPGQRVEIARLTDDSAAFLHLMSEHGLRPGTPIVVITVRAAADTLTLQRADGGDPLTLSADAANTVMVRL